MRVLHISDLHIKKRRGKRDIAVLTRLYDFLRTNAKDKEFDYIAITGDLREAKSAPDVGEVVTILEEIANAAGISEKGRIHIVPGNHDRVNSEKNKQKMKAAKAGYDEQNGIFMDTEDIHLCFEEFFLPLCKMFYGTANPWSTEGDFFHTMCSDGKNAFIYLNSCLVCIDREKDNGLLIGVNFYVRPLIEKTKNAERVFILAHHPIQNLETAEEQNLGELIRPFSEKQTFYWLCGDAHRNNNVDSKDYINLRQVGTVMGSSKGTVTTPEFAIYDISKEEKRRVFNFNPHLNRFSRHPGGWKRVL